MDYQQMRDEITSLCKAQLDRYPMAQPVDILKVLYQGEFGPGHLISDVAKSREFLELEYAEMQAGPDECIEPIGFGFCRLHLNAMDKPGVSMETFFRIFELSAMSHYGSQEGFAQKVAILKELLAEVPDNAVLFRHSEVFREAYRPAYRVVKEEYCRHLALLAKIDVALNENRPIIVAIDGDAASGKTTLACRLHLIYNCNVIHMDHFFLTPGQRTPRRLAEPGGNVDHERFNKEVLMPLVAQRTFAYRPFDCQTWDFGNEITIAPNRLTIVEGCYSHHPALTDAYDVKVFLDVNHDEQMRRIILRNSPEMVEKFRDIWIPMEKKYFSAFDIEQKADLVF